MLEFLGTPMGLREEFRYTIVMTLSQNERLELRILAISDQSPNVRTFVLQKPEGWMWREGAHARFGVMHETTLDQRTMSVSSLPGDEVITMTTRRYATVSPYKAGLWEKQVGDTLWVSAPRSRFTLPREHRPVLMVAMGVGMATLLPLVRTFQNDTSGVESLQVITVDRDIDLFKNEDLSGVSVHHTTNRVAFYKHLDQVLTATKPIVMVVGSDRFVESVVRALKAQGFAQSDLRLDKKSAVIERIWMQS
jgi:ferredoxin-NADP reductase